ncbi:hypothetical protein AWM67_08400 [Riemerella anatipestifer]|uniref:phage tail tube protein n=1 Tax=Riemerella anatipestifer TaxID=34085 RepID=UPI0007EE02FF|nr:hypothetical protein [Riemerella anatipestifer]MDR7846596.1 hypothetical protein [Riemerella anatipestifer]OBP46899.1 hypothetical protein AWM67_08400 [Riemerella anatipestifer]
MPLFNLGVARIELSNIATDGGVGTSFAALGLTQEGTCKIQFGDPTMKKLNVEEFDGGADAILTSGEKKIEFTVANPDEDTLVAVFGGTKSGSAGTTVYKAPSSAVTIERSLKITPKKGLGFIFPRVLITASFTPDIGKESWVGVVVKAEVLTPTKAGEAEWSTFRVA